jgi:hypothetical protein
MGTFRKALVPGILGILVLFLAGCGGGGDSRPVFSEIIDSDRTIDADITKDLVGGTVGAPNLASVFGNVQAGVTSFDGLGSPLTDSRGFLNFPLSRIPLGATIRYASVTVFLNSVTLRDPLAPSPFFLDLIDTIAFPPPVVSSDYSASFAATRSFDFLAGDQGKFVEIEVTSLMQEAQRSGLASFEIRLGFDEAAFQADLSTTRGWVVIDDRASVPLQRPFLTVDYVN